MSEKYLLWVKPSSANFDIKKTTALLHDIDNVESADIVPLNAGSVSRKEAMMAVSLSVTANFATDGIKYVIDKLTADDRAEVVYCRRPDGEEIPIDQLKQIATDRGNNAAP